MRGFDGAALDRWITEGPRSGPVPFDVRCTDEGCENHEGHEQVMGQRELGCVVLDVQECRVCGAELELAD